MTCPGRREGALKENFWCGEKKTMETIVRKFWGRMGAGCGRQVWPGKVPRGSHIEIRGILPQKK